MISESALYATSTAVYAVTFVLLLARIRSVPDRARQCCWLVTGVVGFGALMSALLTAGVGNVRIGGTTLGLPSFANDLVAYAVLWAVSALLANVSRRMLLLVIGIPFAQVVAFQVTSVTGGAVSLATSLFVIAGHFVLLYLFRGPIWGAAAAVPDRQRLLHWKSRNLLLFLIGMLIVFAFLSLVSAFSAFGSTVVGEYVAVLIRVGFAGFLFVNAGALADAAADGAIGDIRDAMGSATTGAAAGGD